MSSGFKKIRHNNWTIYIAAAFLDQDLGQIILAGEDKWSEQQEFKTLPSSARSRIHKFTVKVDDADREVYVKQFLFKSFPHYLKCLFFSGIPARRAFRAEVMLAENGFDVAKTIAMGECREGFFNTKNFLASFGIENAVSVRHYILGLTEIKTPQQLIEWRGFIRDFGQTIGRMHAKGIFHGDLRTGNILLRRDDSSWRFFFIDNERTRKIAGLSLFHRLKNLVQLNMGPHGIINRTDRMRFFTAYRAQNGMSDAMAKFIIKTTMRKTARRLDIESRIRSRMNNALKTNYRFLRIEMKDLTAVFVRAFIRDADPIDFLKKIDAFRKDGQTLQDDSDCFICRLKWNGKDITVKHYKHKGFVSSLLNTIGKSPAKHDWLTGNRHRMMDMPVPEPFVFIERHKNRLIRESYFVSGYIESRKPDDSANCKNVNPQNKWTYRKDAAL
jgi:hypothetical protein